MTNSGAYIGKQIGNYRIVTEIASSYFSHVFRGEHADHRSGGTTPRSSGSSARLPP